jgi:hypothetical protein
MISSISIYRFQEDKIISRLLSKEAKVRTAGGNSVPDRNEGEFFERMEVLKASKREEIRQWTSS